MYKKTLDRMEKRLGADHPRIAIILENLAELYKSSLFIVLNYVELLTEFDHQTARRRYADAEPLVRRMKELLEYTPLMCCFVLIVVIENQLERNMREWRMRSIVWEKYSVL